MADYPTNLPLIDPSQAQKEVTANDLFDAMSPASVFGRNGATSIGLNWGYLGGNFAVATVPTPIANGTLTLAPSDTNYIEVNASGVVSVNQTAFTGGSTPLYT